MEEHWNRIKDEFRSANKFYLLIGVAIFIAVVIGTNLIIDAVNAVWDAVDSVAYAIYSIK